MMLPSSIAISVAMLALFITNPCNLTTRLHLERQASGRGLKVTPTVQDHTPKMGRYFALVIGNNEYIHLTKLRTAINDAEAVAEVLGKRYGFQTRLLRNATRDQILMNLNEYRRSLDEGANLLIYFAGHGYYDKDVDKAYWLPVDAERDNNVNWISADDVTTNIRGIAARHILVVSDSCYSGMIPREGNVRITPAERQRYLRKMILGRCRVLMSSGGNEPVADGDGLGHSVFANAFLQGLAQMSDDEFTSEEVFYKFIREAVAGKADQTPQYSPIRNSGHESGDFVFARSPRIAVNISGRWSLKILVPWAKQQNESLLVLRQVGTSLSGFTDDGGERIDLTDGSFIEDRVAFSLTWTVPKEDRTSNSDLCPEATSIGFKCSGSTDGETMNGTCSVEMVPCSIVMSGFKWTALPRPDNTSQPKGPAPNPPQSTKSSHEADPISLSRAADALARPLYITERDTLTPARLTQLNYMLLRSPDALPPHTELSEGELVVRVLLGAAGVGDTVSDTSLVASGYGISRANDLRYTVIIYNAWWIQSERPPTTRMVIKQGRKEVYREAPTSIYLTCNDRSRLIQFGQLGLSGVKPGRYTLNLEIIAVDRYGRQRTFRRSADFEVAQ
jgi:uncharacterized caspase-like protein